MPGDAGFAAAGVGCESDALNTNGASTWTWISSGFEGGKLEVSGVADPVSETAGVAAEADATGGDAGATTPEFAG